MYRVNTVNEVYTVKYTHRVNTVNTVSYTS